MSDRKDHRDAIVTAIQALDLVADANVGAWRGEEAAFNEDARFPAIYVGYPPEFPAVQFTAPLEINAVTYGRIFDWAVYVVAAGTDSTDVDDAAWTILEGLEDNLPGTDVNGQPLELIDGPNGAERLLAIAHDRAVYFQVYRRREEIVSR